MNSSHLARAKAWIRSDSFRTTAIIVVSALALFLAFEVGVATGFHRAAFSYHLEENYGRTFGTTTNRFMQPGTALPREHGTAGKIVSVTSSVVTIAPASGPEQQVDFDASTLIRNLNNAASSTALTAGTSVVVFGEPTDSGTIHARLIRIIPTPSTP